MNTKELIKNHETCIAILEAMQHFISMVRINKESLQGHARNFPYLVEKYNHKIDIYNRCIIRLSERYKRFIN